MLTQARQFAAALRRRCTSALQTAQSAESCFQPERAPSNAACESLRTSEAYISSRCSSESGLSFMLLSDEALQVVELIMADASPPFGRLMAQSNPTDLSSFGLVLHILAPAMLDEIRRLRATTSAPAAV
jgi:hypothetical protein